MRHLLCIVFLLFLAGPALALVIDQDTLWQGDLHFQEDIQVMPEVTLTIETGSRINFKGNRLEVSGHLVADGVEFVGDEWEGLLLKGSDERTVLRNCAIKGAKIGVLVKGGAPVLEGLLLLDNQVGIELRGRAGGQLVKSIFKGNKNVGLFIKDDSTTSVTDCTFIKNPRYGAYLYHAAPDVFISNAFLENEIGLIIAYHGTDPVIEKNRFEKNNIAVQVDRAARPTIRNNHILSNRTGLHAYRRSDPLVTNNRIEGNDIGMLVAYSSYPQIEGNDFVYNGMAIRLEFQSSAWEAQNGEAARADESAARTAFGGQNMRTVTEADRRADHLDGKVSAVGNWWGEAGTDELEKVGAEGNPSFIHDGRDQATFVDADQEYPLDHVLFSPWSGKGFTEILP